MYASFIYIPACVERNDSHHLLSYKGKVNNISFRSQLSISMLSPSMQWNLLFLFLQNNHPNKHEMVQKPFLRLELSKRFSEQLL